MFKGRKKIFDQNEVSADQAEWNNFENKKKKMLMDNGVNPNPFSMLDDTSRQLSGMSDEDHSHKENGLTGQLNSYFRKKMNINLNYAVKKEHSVFTPPKGIGQVDNTANETNDNTFNFRPQRVPVTKKSTHMVSSGKDKGNSRVVHFPKETLEYDEDEGSDERFNPLTNTTITSHIPKLPVPKMKQIQK